MTDTCETCRYGLFTPGPDPEIPWCDSEEVCRRYPKVGDLPLSEWCGEYKPKPASLKETQAKIDKAFHEATGDILSLAAEWIKDRDAAMADRGSQ